MSTQEETFGALFESQLVQVVETELPKWTTAKLVQSCLAEIRQARQCGHSWDAIAQALQAAARERYDGSLSLAASTVKRTYYRLASQSRRRGSRKRKPKSPVAAPLTRAAQGVATASPARSDAEVARPDALVSPARPESEDAPPEAPESTPVDVYARPPGSRFTPGYRVKYWTGGESDD